MQFSYFNFKGATLHFAKAGQGTKTLLAFHGIGQDISCFDDIVQSLGNQYTFYVFDLFYHGKSGGLSAAKPSQSDRLSKTFWTELIREFCVQQKISRFSVAGFSMGGKFALATTEAFPERLETMYLFAPDGISESIWYRIATRFWPARQVFRLIVFNPSFSHQLGRVFLRFGWVNKSTLRFIESTLITPQQQAQVYYSWLCFSTLRFEMPHIARLCNKHTIKVKFFLGRFDALIPESSVYALTNKLNDYELVMLKTGHHRLVEKAAEWLQSSPHH